jgi:hypothetical protein
MDPVRAIRTPATYPVECTGGSQPRRNPPEALPGLLSPEAFVTGQCYRLVPVSLVRRAKYSGAMSPLTPPMPFPGPRDGLDEGSLAELAQDGREVGVEVESRRPWFSSAISPIHVPDDASALIDGLDGYGT